MFKFIEFPENYKKALLLLAKDEQCETAWTHIINCERCRGILFFVIHMSFADTNKVAKEIAMEALETIATQEEIEQISLL